MNRARRPTVAAWLGLFLLIGLPAGADERPNILWILAEDASPNLSAYGERAIETPRLDRLAREGVRFTRASTSCPVCSPSRSALIAGMYQTTFGSHNHRSCNDDPKARANPENVDSDRVPKTLKLIPELFAEAGYKVVNGGKGKEDYNFIARNELYSGKDWKERKKGQPFFAQVQLQGGKARGTKVAHPADPTRVEVPPYYPADPVIRRDWAGYLDTWIKTDADAGEVLDRLAREGLAESTAVFFFTDHGVSHVRGKQFLYEEGVRVPLLVRLPGGRLAGIVRNDLVSLIDVAATSLDLAGLPVPDYVQGRPLFQDGSPPRRFVFSARDRCDETVDLIRSARSDRFKYIRNFMPYVSHAQPNRYKDGKDIMKRMRTLHAQSALNELQDRVFSPTRPSEELYDLQDDPHETINLAQSPKHQSILIELRTELHEWMVSSRDLGLIPEPILEELGAKYGSRYAVLRAPENAGLLRTLLGTIQAGESRDQAALKKALVAPHPATRYWAAVWLGVGKDPTAAESLKAALNDSSTAVRVAAARALFQLDRPEGALEVLGQALDDRNVIAGHYAIRALEEIGAKAAPLLPRIQAARNNPYDSTSRIAVRLTAALRAGRQSPREGRPE